MGTDPPEPIMKLRVCIIAALLVAAVGCSTRSPETARPPAGAASPVSAEKDELYAPLAERRENLTVANEPAPSTPAAVAGAMSLAKDKWAVGAVRSVATAPPGSLVAIDRMQPQPREDRETYGHYDANPVQRVAENPVSTFSIDVDTGSYSNVRRFLNGGQLPPADAVRVEELINYFDYAYAPPTDRSTPFAVHTEVAPTPWSAHTQLLRVGIQGWKPARIPPSNLVFLVDVSGSMDEPDKLPLVKSALKMMARQMSSRDRISLVVYAGNTGVVLEPTAGDQGARIEAALDHLEAGGSTNGAAGIELAYKLARQVFIEGGNNRVLLATDGDFNVGVTSFEHLLDLIRDERKSGIALTTLGVGTGNYNDRLMEQLADAGDGNYAYLDSLKEAQKVLVDQLSGTLTTIARDVKIQIEFNPATVAEYRLIGYEDRMLKREDFNNDKVDAGDIGAGHRVTALYEIALAGSGGETVDALRYGARQQQAAASGDELAFVRLRYKRPEDGVDAVSHLIEKPIQRRDIESASQVSATFRLAAAVAAYGQLLRGGAHTGNFGYADVEKLAHDAAAADARGDVGELIQLARLADGLGSKQARAQGEATGERGDWKE
jgi:Ca-activated chloride channel family protein